MCDWTMLGPTLWKDSFGQSHFRGQPNSMSSVTKVRRKIWAFSKPQCPSPWVIGTCPFAMEWAAQPFSGHTELLSQILLPIKATLMFQWRCFLPSSRAKHKPEYLLCLLKSPAMRPCQFSMNDDKKQGWTYWAVKGQSQVSCPWGT